MCSGFLFIALTQPLAANAAPTNAELKARKLASAQIQADKVRTLLEQISSRDIKARKKAASALSKFNAKARLATPDLILALTKGDDFTQIAVARYLGKMGRTGSPAALALGAVLKDGSFELRMTSMYSLYLMGTLGAPAAPALIGLLNDANKEVRIASIKTLGKLGLKAVPELIEALSNSQPNVRENALYAIGRIGFNAKAAVPSVLNFLSDKDANTRALALKTIEKIGAVASAATPNLIESLSDSNATVRAHAAQALGRFHRKDAAAAIPALTAALQDKNLTVRSEAAHTLSGLGGDPDVLLEPLIKAMSNKNRDTRLRASSSLAKIGTKAIPGLLVTLNATTDGERQFELIDLINAIGPPLPQSSLALVKEMANSPHDRIKYFAKAILAYVEAPKP